MPAPRRLARRQFARPSRLLPFLLTLGLSASAQYVGRTQKDEQKKPPPPRAVSVLEWVGDPGKPVASRIVPVTVFVDGQYQDGGLYLAQPAPLTVESDTLYELEKAGVPKGTFDVAGGENVAGAWFGYGRWQPLAAPKPAKKLAPSKTPPKVVQDSDPDRPHLKNSSPPSDSSTPGGSSQSAGGSSPSAPDPDKPTLHRRTDADSGQSASGAGTAPEDPDRPHLRKRTDATASSSDSSDDGSPVSSVNEADPDRPKLGRGKPATTQTQLQATKLIGLPPDLQQMAAVSDAAVREEHGYNYQWPDPGDAAKLQTAVEALAIKAVLADGASPTIKAATASTTPPAIRPGAPRNTLAHRVPPKALPVVLSETDFHAYELSYSGGATLVFTGKALVGPNNAGVTLEKYVTIIAQPDFNGDPQVRLQSVTDPKHLDITPRMRLVDAVDTQGDNQAELIFELRRASDRQFAIYRVRGLRVEQAFATESLPYVTPSHIETKAN